MARASRQEAQQHRKDIVEAASRLFREKGLGRVSVPELMAAAGLTHGGFYGHFASKDALAAEAFAEAFAQMAGRIGAAGKAAAPADGLHALIGDYLSVTHRDHPELGCPTAALLDFARDTADGEVGRIYSGGVEGMVAAIAALDPTKEGARERALATLATLVGALLLSRATRGTALSEAFLDAAKAKLTEPVTA